MWEELIKLAVSNGIWAVLFVALLLYQLKDSATREVKYQQTIASLTDKLNIVEDIRGDIADIKKSINKASKAKQTKRCDAKLNEETSACYKDEWTNVNLIICK